MNYGQHHLKKMHSEHEYLYVVLVNKIKTILHIPTLEEELFVH